MNRKAFTLVELLAVIVIIGIIGMLTIPAVMNIIRDSREDKKAADVSVILKASYDYVQKNSGSLPSTNLASVDITIHQLQAAGLLKLEITDSETEFESTDIIRITYYTSDYVQANNISAEKFQRFFGNYLFSYEGTT